MSQDQPAAAADLTGSQLALLLRLAVKAARRVEADMQRLDRTTAFPDAMLADVLAEVAAERARQDVKWGQQDHPSLDQVLLRRPGGCSERRMAEEYELPTAGRARSLCEKAARDGSVTFAHILIEEVAEAVGCLDDEEAMRAELIQVAAVAVAWVQAIDRRRDGSA